MSEQELKYYILGCASDVAKDFIYYDRKEDEELCMDVIQNAVKNNVLTIDEIVEAFRKGLMEDWE